MDANSNGTALGRFFRLLKPDRREIAYLYTYAILSGLIALTLPLGIQAIIGLITSGRLPTSWTFMVLVVTLGVLAVGILSIFQLIITEVLQQRIFVRSAYEFALRLPQFDMEQLRNRYAPELMNRFFDTLTIQKGLPKVLLDFSRSILEILFGLILLSLYHPVFIIFGLGIMVTIVIIFRLTGPAGLRTSIVESSYKYKVAYWLEEVARSGATFKLWGGTKLHLEKTDKLVSLYLESRKKHFRILMFQYVSIIVFRTVITAGLLIIGSILVVQGLISIGQFVAAEIIILLVISSVEKLIQSMETIYDMLTAIEKIKEIVELPLEEKKGHTFSTIDTGEGFEVKAKDLSYKFSDSETLALNDLNFEFKPNERICIAGYNSSGKSTLLKIFTGVYHGFEGELTYNGMPVKAINPDELRRHVGDHSQQEDLFDGSLAENIALGSIDCNVEMMLWAIEAVGLKTWFTSLPNGLDTEILPGGQTLPGAVKEKIILARSIVNQPRLLAIEEFLNQMEPSEKLRLVDFLVDRKHKWTLVIISNDPTVAKACDRVIVMRKGKILENGSYEDIQNSEYCQTLFNPGSDA